MENVKRFFDFLMRHRGFGLRSASVVAKQVPPAPSNPVNYVVRGSNPLSSTKNVIQKNDISNETSGIRTPDNLIKSQVLYHLS